MMRIRTEHETLEGSPAQLVNQLNKESLAHADSNKRYMQEAADRATMTTGIDVRFDSPEHFILDLAKSGLIEILKDDEK